MRFPRSLRPFRLLRQDLHNLRLRYVSDWTVFNQLVVASAIYVFFTNLLPGITFANDLYVLTGKSWGTIEVVFSTGLCGVIFSMWVQMKLLSSGSPSSWPINRKKRTRLMRALQILDSASHHPGRDWTLLSTC